MLNGNLDKTHCVPSYQTSERNNLHSVMKRDPIAWPKMSHADDWAKFDNVISTLLVGGPYIFECVDF